MSLPLSRAAGNLAKANPRHYSTGSENAFLHRNAPPMPSLDHILQPGRDLVSLVSLRLHSVLGTAWQSLQHPMPLWMPALEMIAQPRSKPTMTISSEMPAFVQNALLLVSEENKGFTWEQEKSYEWEEEQARRRKNKDRLLQLFSPTALRHQQERAADGQGSSDWTHYMELWKYGAYGLMNAHPNFGLASEPEPVRVPSQPSFHRYNALLFGSPQLQAIRVPTYSGLDNDPLPEIDIMPAPTSSHERAVAIAILAAGVAVATVSTVLAGFLRKWW